VNRETLLLNFNNSEFSEKIRIEAQVKISKFIIIKQTFIKNMNASAPEEVSSLFL
jgi:hypothetical protein